MKTANLQDEEIKVHNGKDSVVIVKVLGTLPGGATLNVTGQPTGTTVISAGHILVKDNSTNEIETLGISSGAYVEATGKSYVGVLASSVLVSRPFAAVLIAGTVNANASPYPVTDAIKTALPGIRFI